MLELTRSASAISPLVRRCSFIARTSSSLGVSRASSRDARSVYLRLPNSPNTLSGGDTPYGVEQLLAATAFVEVAVRNAPGVGSPAFHEVAVGEDEDRGSFGKEFFFRQSSTPFGDSSRLRSRITRSGEALRHETECLLARFGLADDSHVTRRVQNGPLPFARYGMTVRQDYPQYERSPPSFRWIRSQKTPGAPLDRSRCPGGPFERGQEPRRGRPTSGS